MLSTLLHFFVWSILKFGSAPFRRKSKVENPDLLNSDSRQFRRKSKVYWPFGSVRLSSSGKYKAWLAMSKMTRIALTNDGLPTPEELGSERFKAFMEAHKVHGSYVTKHKLVDLDLWAPVFQGNLATGQHSMSPSLAKSQTNRSIGKALVDDQLEGSGDSDDINGPTNISTSVSEPALSRSPPKTNSSKKKKLFEIDKAYKLLKRTETNCSEDQLIEAMSNLEEVKSRGERFIAKCIKYLVEEGLDKLFPKLRSDAQNGHGWKMSNENMAAEWCFSQ